MQFVDKIPDVKCGCYHFVGVVDIGCRQTTNAEVDIANSFYFLDTGILANDMIEMAEAIINFFDQFGGRELLTDFGEIFKIGKHNRHVFVVSGLGDAFFLKLFHQLRR